MNEKNPLAALALALFTVAASWCASLPGAEPEPRAIPAAVARVDITPDYATRLNGYGGRRAESSGTAQRLFAKALALGEDGGEGPAVIVTLDSLGVPDSFTEELAGRLKVKAGL